MIKIEFTEKDIEALDYERYHHPHPRVRKKMEALWLKSQNLAHSEICRLARISPKTLQRYLHEYQFGGIESLKLVKFYQPQSLLNNHQSAIEGYFREHPPGSIKEAKAKIEQMTGIKRSVARVRKFLLKTGIKRRKVGMIPAKANADEQESFKKEKLEPRLREARLHQRVVYFVDAAHFVLAPFLGYLWSFTRLFLKAPAGRKRFNVLGAINAIDHQLITVTNDLYINADSVCDLLRKLALIHTSLPITLVLDNARYQKCKLVIDLATSLKIELLYLPPYSPNLNLIERLWKFVKKTCLYSKYYESFLDFKTAISQCLSQTHSTYKQELDSLLTLNFQTFKNTSLVTI